jgi:hypothetical protein
LLLPPNVANRSPRLPFRMWNGQNLNINKVTGTWWTNSLK